MSERRFPPTWSVEDVRANLLVKERTDQMRDEKYVF